MIERIVLGALVLLVLAILLVPIAFLMEAYLNPLWMLTTAFVFSLVSVILVAGIPFAMVDERNRIEREEKNQ